MKGRVFGAGVLLVSILVPMDTGRDWSVSIAAAASPTTTLQPSSQFQEVLPELRAAFERTGGRVGFGAGRIHRDTNTTGPWSQQQELAASNGAQNDQFGASVAMSRDGNYAIIGAPDRDNLAGAAYVFVRNGNTWTEQHEFSTGVANTGFGASVALDSSGTRALVSAPSRAAGAPVATVHVFVRTGTTWSQEQVLTNGIDTYDTEFGDSVSLSDDGSTALIGALGEGPNGDQNQGVDAGGAYVFVRSGTQWTEQQRVETGLVNSYFGRSVSISGDGMRALVGAYHENNFVGAAYLYVSTGGVWTQEGSFSTGLANGQFGWSVALNGDGSTAVIGTRGESTLTGAAYVYTRSASTWSQQQRLAASDAAQFDQFGYSVALSSDGNTALVGALSKAAGAGATYAFIRSSSTWAEQQKLTAVNAAKGDNFGDAVTLSGDAGTALIGANGKTSLTGAAYVFTQSAGSGSQLVLSGYPASTPSGSPFSLTVSIQNGSGQPLPSYVGTVHLTSSDPQASLPSDYTFTPADAGTHTFSVTLNTPGRNAQQSQTITVTDTVTTTLTATTTPITVTSLTTAPTVTQGWYLIGGSPLSLWPGATNVFSWNALTGQWFTPTGNEPPGTGAWEFVASQATNTITVQRCARSITLTVQVRRWNMVGNPCDATVTLPTGTRVLLWDSTHQRYLPATTIPPGEGAWILPLAGPLPLTPS